MTLNEYQESAALTAVYKEKVKEVRFHNNDGVHKTSKDISYDEVATKNLLKLKARSEKGTIKGSGDER